MSGQQVNPQLRADFEEATPAEWGFGRLDTAVAVGDPYLGTQGARFDYTLGATRAKWTRTQLSSANDCTRWLLAVWMKHTLVPAWPAASEPEILAVCDFVNPCSAVRMAGSGGGVVLAAGGTEFALASPPVGTWEFWEMRGYLDGVWYVDLRRDGIDVTTITTALTAPIRVSNVGLGSGATVGGGLNDIDYHADRMWWWAGSDGDPIPAWWSDASLMAGLTGDTVVTAAAVGPTEVAAQSGDQLTNDGGETVHVLAGVDQDLPITITANVTLDAQPIEIGLVPRGESVIVWDTAAWAGTAGPTRVANLPIGPSETVDPVAGIYEVWVQVDGGAPVLADGEVVVI